MDIQQVLQSAKTHAGGPCFTIDTACSSTLVAMDCAVQASRLVGMARVVDLAPNSSETDVHRITDVFAAMI